MKTYIGTKVLRSKPMNRGEYNTLRGWETPLNENPADAGYLVEYLDSPNPNHQNFEFYISWSPADVFERAHRETEAMPFGLAVEAMKKGFRVQRAGWNGKGMWICRGEGSPGLPSTQFWNKHTRAFAEANGGFADVLPYFIMKTADNKILMGWLASQTDMDADDWMIV